MIIKTFDNGWGNQFPLKQYERNIVDTMLSQLAVDPSRTVLINSVWYTDEYHQQVLSWMRKNDFDQIVLVAMLDAAIPNCEWYVEFDCPVHCVGYYPGKYSVDFWALFVDHFLQLPSADVLNADLIDTPFMCLNRKPHWHRRKLYSRLEEFGLLDRGIVSMGGGGVAVRALDNDREHDDLAPNAGRDHYGIPNDIASLGHMINWNRHLLNVVTETCYNINQTNFVSEKIYKPIVGCRPFLIYDPDGGTRWLTDRGFEPYVKDFEDISDADLSESGNLAPFLLTLCEQPVDYWQKKFIDLKPKMLYNKNHFAEYVKQQKLIVEKGITCPV
jgi:hypothetical protein